MPIYEYVCNECEQITELLQKVGAEAPSECKSCGKPDTMKKKVSQTSFQLKGRGWYSDLYGSSPQNDSPKPDKKETDVSPPVPNPPAKEPAKETKKSTGAE